MFHCSIVQKEENMPFLFEKLEVYQKTIAFINEIEIITKYFPKGNYYTQREGRQSCATSARS
jgi:hypothetical protein